MFVDIAFTPNFCKDLNKLKMHPTIVANIKKIKYITLKVLNFTLVFGHSFCLDHQLPSDWSSFLHGNNQKHPNYENAT